jgi:hypothetical protein
MRRKAISFGGQDVDSILDQADLRRNIEWQEGFNEGTVL